MTVIKIEKPEISEAIWERCKTLLRYFKENPDRDITKKEICEEALGWEYPRQERQTREVISNLGKAVPIIATSDTRGYRLATTAEDMEKVKHQLNELNSRKLELDLRCDPLKKFIDRYSQGAQISLFDKVWREQL